MHYESVVHELNDEVRNERKIRAEIERVNSQQEELTASLIMNLGIEFMKWRQENTERQVVAAMVQREENKGNE